MSTPPIVISDAHATWEHPSRGRVGMLCLISAESAIFTIFVVAYLFYIGRSLTGPAPKDVRREIAEEHKGWRLRSVVVSDAHIRNVFSRWHGS